MSAEEYGPADIVCPYCGEETHVEAGATKLTEITHCGDRWIIVDLEAGEAGHTNRRIATDGGRPRFLFDRVEAEYRGEVITIWNHLTVTQSHYVTAGLVESEHDISPGDSPSADSPDYITPEMDEQLRMLDVYPDAKVVDPHDDEVELL